MTVQALLVLEGVECQQLLLFGSVCKFACTLQGLDCNMRLDIQRLDPGMVVLHGMACISYDYFSPISGPFLTVRTIFLSCVWLLVWTHGTILESVWLWALRLLIFIIVIVNQFLLEICCTNITEMYHLHAPLWSSCHCSINSACGHAGDK